MFIVDSSWFSWRQNDWHLLHNIVHGNHFDFNDDKSVRKWRFNRPKLGSKCNMDLWWDGNFKEIYLNSFWQQHGTQLERQLHWHWRGITCKSCSKFIVLWCLNTPYLLTFVQNAIKQTDIVKCADLQPSRQLQSFFFPLSSSSITFIPLHTYEIACHVYISAYTSAIRKYMWKNDGNREKQWSDAIGFTASVCNCEIERECQKWKFAAALNCIGMTMT